MCTRGSAGSISVNAVAVLEACGHDTDCVITPRPPQLPPILPGLGVRVVAEDCSAVRPASCSKNVVDDVSNIPILCILIF